MGAVAVSALGASDDGAGARALAASIFGAVSPLAIGAAPEDGRPRGGARAPSGLVMTAGAGGAAEGGALGLGCGTSTASMVVGSTIWMAFDFGLGGAPAAPAGTALPVVLVIGTAAPCIGPWPLRKLLGFCMGRAPPVAGVPPCGAPPPGGPYMGALGGPYMLPPPRPTACPCIMAYGLPIGMPRPICCPGCQGRWRIQVGGLGLEINGS